jgi:hypothetical protein
MFDREEAFAASFIAWIFRNLEAGTGSRWGAVVKPAMMF